MGRTTTRYGTRFSDLEIQHAAEYLSNRQLIKGVGTVQTRGPLRAEITTEGIDCVTDWESNVAEYLRDQRGYGPTISHGPVIHGNTQGGQWAEGTRAGAAGPRSDHHGDHLDFVMHRRAAWPKKSCPDA